MYFKSRMAAGELLAAQLVKKYRYEACAVIALSDGAAMVGAEIAMRLHCPLSLLLTASISLPQESAVLAEMNQLGGVTYNDMLSAGELEEMQAEYFGYLEEQKLQKKFEMNRLLGAGGLIDQDMLKEHVVIVVSDGLNNGLSLAAAADFLKPIRIKKLVVATPFASVEAVDRMHILADEIYCLNVIEDIISIDHYYDTEHSDVPPHDVVIQTIEEIILNWK
jgi:predicted phosphoribosyltransferase